MTERYIVKQFTAFHVDPLDKYGPPPEGFKQELSLAFRQEQNSFEYGGSTFTIEPGPGHGFAYVAFNGIPDYTPAVFFHGGVPLAEVHLTTWELPDMLRAAPGWYYRDEDVGQFLSWVHVDPYGDNPYKTPTVTARGKQLNPLVAFFNEVMAGTIRPSSRV
jgi:hypothetical protein